jgi:hypothetical protein
VLADRAGEPDERFELRAGSPGEPILQVGGGRGGVDVVVESSRSCSLSKKARKRVLLTFPWVKKTLSRGARRA